MRDQLHDDACPRRELLTVVEQPIASRDVEARVAWPDVVELPQAHCRAAAGREIFAVHVVAREELDPRASGVVVDPEDALMRRPLNAREIADYQSAFGAFRQSLADRFRAAGAAYQLVTTGEEADQAIRRVVTPHATSAQRS